MSIIYDALKKLGKTSSAPLAPVNTDPGATAQKPSSKHRYYVLCLIVICLGFVGANMLHSYFWSIPRPAATAKIALSVAEKTSIFKGDIPEARPSPQIEQPDEKTISYISPETRMKKSLVLNGIFYSEDGTYALINNQIVRSGDVIEEAKVISIGQEEVVLEYEGVALTLHTRK